MTEDNYETRKAARLRDVFYMYLGGIAIFTIAVVISQYWLPRSLW